MADRRESGTYAYKSVANELRRRIAGQEYRLGDQLPTEAELGEQHGVSRQTIRRAMQELVGEGLVYRVQGSGTFVGDRDGRLRRPLGSVEALLSLSDDTVLEIVSPLQRCVSIDAAARLRLDSDVVYRLAYRRLYRDLPVSFTVAYVPESIGKRLEDIAEFHVAGATTVAFSTIIGFIEVHTGVAILAADQTITIDPLPIEASQLVEPGAGDMMLRIDRIYLEENERPVELAISWWDPRLYTYRVRLQRRNFDAGYHPSMGLDPVGDNPSRISDHHTFS